MTTSQILATALFCVIFPAFLVLGGWTGLVAAAKADAKREKEILRVMAKATHELETIETDRIVIKGEGL